MASVLLQELSQILGSSHEFEGITLSEVSLTTDCRHAKIFVREGFRHKALTNEKERETYMAALNAQASRLQAELGRMLRVRFAPELKFEYDAALEKAERVLNLIHQGPGGDDDL